VNGERHLAAGNVPVDGEDLPLDPVLSGLDVLRLPHEELGIGFLVDFKVLVARGARQAEMRVSGVNAGVKLQPETDPLRIAWALAGMAAASRARARATDLLAQHSMPRF
jgi:hypothetical protein